MLIRTLGFMFATGLLSSLTQAATGTAPEHGLIPFNTSPIHAKSNQKNYDLYIQLPESYHKKGERYPLIIVNDCRWGFPIVSGSVTLMADRVIREAVTVCISYSKGDDRGLSRTRDYTPTYSPVEPSGHSTEARKASGHAKEYTAFIADELIPMLKNKYRIDDTNKIFIGHSFGGLLGSYILLNRPNLFDHYIIGSPSLWYDNRVIFEMEKTYADNHKDLKAHAMIFVDDNDGKPSDMQMDTNVMALDTLLKSRNYPSLVLDTRLLKGANHHSVFPQVVAQGLMAAIPLNKKL